MDVHGLRGKRPEIIQAIVKEHLDLVLLQETLPPEHLEWRMVGYILHSLQHGEDGRRGSMTGGMAKYWIIPRVGDKELLNEKKTL